MKTKNNNKLYVLVINYNYTNMFYDNILYYENLDLPIHFIDDQSSKFQHLLKKIDKKFRVIVTEHNKSRYNAINQLNAIACGFNKIRKELNNSDYIWVIDADDVPLFTPEISNSDEDVLLYQHINEHVNYLPSYNGLWFKDAPTSSVIIKVEYLIKHYNKIFSNKIGKDVWFDIRVGCFDPKYAIYNKLLMKKIIHGSNDSDRYKKNLIIKYFRIFNTVYYKLISNKIENN